MNRIDRLTAILVHLQSKRIVKAKEIAERFNISLRTVYRDIRALEDAGVPIGATPGEGYYIVEGFYLPPVMFTRDEASAMFIGGKLIERYADSTIKEHFTAALYKIKSVLNSEEKEHLETLSSRVEVLKEPLPEQQDNHLAQIQSILGRNTVTSLKYHSLYKDEETTRDIEPLGLCFYASNWHLIAYCRLRDEYRDFRVDRMLGLVEKDETFDRCQHDSLQNLVQQIVKSEKLIPVVLRFDKSLARAIREEKYYFGFVEEKEEKEHVIMHFMVPSFFYFSKWIMAFGNKVEVVSPETLNNMLKDMAGELNKHYNDGIEGFRN